MWLTSGMESHFLVEMKLKREEIISPDRYPFFLPAFHGLDSLEFHPSVTFFVGENGAGKSTLLEAIAIAAGFNAEGGSKNFRFATSETHSDLSEHIRLSRGIQKPRDGYFLRAESFYNVANEMDARDQEPSFDAPINQAYGGKSLHERSHGEAFFSLFMDRFRGSGLYLLDEPEAALSAQRQLAFLVRLHELVEAGSQLIIATHAPILLSYPNSVIYRFSESGIEPIAYEQTEAFVITKRFLDDPRAMLKNLLS
jgi:predicted ATPase